MESPKVNSPGHLFLTLHFSKKIPKEMKPVPVSRVITVSKNVGEDKWEAHAHYREYTNRQKDNWYHFNLPFPQPLRFSHALNSVSHPPNSTEADLLTWDGYCKAEMVQEFTGKWKIRDLYPGTFDRRDRYEFKQMPKQKDELGRWAVTTLKGETMYIVKQIDPNILILESFIEEPLYKFEVTKGSVPKETLSKIAAFFSIEDNF